MKCKACNGKGYFTECIYESDEVGFVDKDYECAVCHGTGQIEQTNEEWFDGLSTEEKAKALHKLYWEIQNHIDYSPDEDDYVEEYCLYWLKKVAE